MSNYTQILLWNCGGEISPQNFASSIIFFLSVFALLLREVWHESGVVIIRQIVMGGAIIVTKPFQSLVFIMVWSERNIKRPNVQFFENYIFPLLEALKVTVLLINYLSISRHLNRH